MRSLQLYINLGKWLFTPRGISIPTIHLFIHRNCHQKKPSHFDPRLLFFLIEPNPKLQNLMYSFKSFATFWCDLNFAVNIGSKSVLTQCMQSSKMINLLTFNSELYEVFHKIHACWLFFLPVEFFKIYCVRVDLLYTDNDI